MRKSPLFLVMLVAWATAAVAQATSITRKMGDFRIILCFG